MFLGYNTNGLAHHALPDAFRLLADTGFHGVAITLDHDLLERCGPEWRWRVPLDRLRAELDLRGLKCVVETGARFILDPAAKHAPNLMDPVPLRRELRRAYYRRALELARELNAGCVSIWSGACVSEDGADERELWNRLADGVRGVLKDAENAGDASVAGIRVAFEPEPGMFIDTVARFERLLDVLADRHGSEVADALGLTLDVGHLHCQGEPMDAAFRRHAARVVNVHLEDAVSGRHEHLPLGEGEVDFPALFRTLADVGYRRGVFVELSRHSHTAHTMVPQAFGFLRQLLSRDDF